MAPRTQHAAAANRSSRVTDGTIDAADSLNLVADTTNGAIHTTNYATDRTNQLRDERNKTTSIIN